MLFDNGFIFGGKSTADFCACAEKYPPLGAPARKYETITVPGRNGDLHIAQDAFHNFIQAYEIYFHDSSRSSPQVAHDIKSWLLGATGYRRLEDVYDPEHFRLAAYYGPLDISNQLNKYGRCTIQFDCKPQSYLKNGETPILMGTPGIVRNPCAFTARPLIRIFGAGAASMSISGTAVDILDINESLVLDCDIQTAYKGTENKNNTIYAPEFPVLAPGENEISWTGGVTSVEIIPRWWEL